MLLGSHSRCSIADCPVSFCDCMCHRHPGVMHCMPCCRTAKCPKCGLVKDQVGAVFHRESEGAQE